MGHARPEPACLMQQVLLRRSDRNILLKAGLTTGMRVLDVGCGVGNISFIAAKFVGLEGAVIGVDKAQEAIAFARQRAHSAELSNVQFIVADLADFRFDSEPVDALVVMYVPDPATVLYRLLAFVKPGGIIAFHELVLRPSPPPEIMSDPLCEACVGAVT